MAVTKVDLLRESRELYVPPRTPVLVDVPEFKFLMIDGHGDPNSSLQPAIQALYGASYKLKFALKRGPLAVDYKVMPLEGLWSVPDMTTFSVEHKDDWDWTLMIRQPDEVDEQMLADLPVSGAVRLERWEEGQAAQLMHVGPYAEEGPSVERLHAFIEEQGLERAGRHHEIYLGDPRRAAPEKLRTVLRQPARSR
jgi:hypothetical protein